MPCASLDDELFNPNKVMQGRVELGPSSHQGTDAFCPFYTPDVPFQGCASRGSLTGLLKPQSEQRGQCPRVCPKCTRDCGTPMQLIQQPTQLIFL